MFVKNTKRKNQQPNVTQTYTQNVMIVCVVFMTLTAANISIESFGFFLSSSSWCMQEEKKRFFVLVNHEIG